MSKREDAKEILKSLGLPKPQQNERSCLTLLALAGLSESAPWAKTRHAELEAMLKECPARRVYVTAFMDFTGFKKYASEVVWEAEVWIAEFPDHMIHFNGDKFLGPSPPRNEEDE